MTLAERIKDHIVTQYLGGDGDGLDDDTPLFALNVIDSVSMFDLVRFLSSEASVRIGRAEMTAANFETIAAMVRLVESARSAAS